jgi:hypothetical protein
MDGCMYEKISSFIVCLKNEARVGAVKSLTGWSDGWDDQLWVTQTKLHKLCNLKIDTKKFLNRKLNGFR